MKGCAFPLILLILATPAVAVEVAAPAIQAFEGKLRPKDWQRLAVDPTQPRQFIEITRDFKLSCQIRRNEPTPRLVTILKGVYSIDRRLHPKKGGTDWLVVPAVSSEQIRLGYNNSAGRTWGYEHAIALHPDSLAIFPREIVRYTQEWSRLDGSRWDEPNWTFGCVPSLMSAAQPTTMRLVSEEQFQVARSGQARQAVLDVLDERLQHKQALDKERPMKSQVGAQLCRERGPLLLQGFTENRSPDNGKVQIRIWRASLSDLGRPSTVVPGDFRESVVWDDPDNWSLCEY